MDGIIFRTTDGARWGAAGGLGTAGNLTQTQFDENNWELLTRIQALENEPPTAPVILGFTVIGSQMTINMSDATTFGPFTLPIAVFRDVGIWTNDQPLVELDLFSVPGRGYYRTLISHTTPSAPAVFDPTATDEDSGSPTFGEPLYALVLGEDAAIYDVGFFMPGRPGQGIDAGAEMFAHTFCRTVMLEAGAPGSIAKLKLACGADIDLDVYKEADVIGTIHFESGDTDGTFTVTDAVNFAIDDTLWVAPPASIDASARGLKITFKCLRTDF